LNQRQEIRSEARVLGLRLRLGLTSLPAIEDWIRRAGLSDEPSEMQARLVALGGVPGAHDVMRALSVNNVQAQSSDGLRQIADGLEPILKEMEARKRLPDLLRPALRFAREYRDAETRGDGSAILVDTEMQAMLHAIKEHVAELPEDIDHAEPQARTGVSAIVVSYRTGEVLFDCLRALEADPGIEEIVLVDNGNPKDVLWRIDELAAASSKLKVTGGGENRGFSAGVNLGVAQSKGARLLIINPDAILQPGSTAALENARANLAEPIVIGGKIFGDDGQEQRGARRRRLTLSSAAVTFLGMGWLKAFNPAFVGVNLNNEPAPDGPVPVGAVSGALMYMSRAGFDRLGGFDEGYFLHVEDIDLCRRAEADGGSVIYTPLASALHHGASSGAPSFAVERYKAAGLGRYFRKFAETPTERLTASVLGPLITFALVVRARFRRKA
jgi:GT2 family glycosyltransferase